MKLKEIKETISKSTNNKRNHIKGRSRSSGTTDMELFVKIANSSQFTGSKSKLTLSIFFKHAVTTNPVYVSQVYNRDNCYCF